MIEHNHCWGEWCGYDEHVIEAGMTNGYRYHRTCMILGCNARQETEHLEPKGKFRETPNSL